MIFSDETLMAYADGELDATTRLAVEQAIRHDPSLAARVREHQVMRKNVFGAYASTLEEQVPFRLRQAARSPKVIHLDTVRAQRAQPPAPERPRWALPEWGAIAASVVVGVLIGAAALHTLQGESHLTTEGGTLLATGRLNAALSGQLAAAAMSEAGVRFGPSFVAKDGNYCRTFMLTGSAGLACRNGEDWKVPVMTATTGEGGAYRQASSSLPPAVLEAMDERIVGKPLDAAGEQQAVRQGWKRRH